MSYGRIGVIGAMDSELAALIAALAQPAQETVQGLIFHTGRLGAREVVLVRCGIGKVSAARCTQVLIDRFAPGAVINTGIAGGLAGGLAVGDIVVADGLVQHDFDAAPIGFVRGCVCMGDPGAPTVFAPDAALSALLAQTAGNTIGAQQVHRGLIATGDQFISGAAAKAAIRRAFPAAMAAEMEGGAVAQAASMSGVPFAVIANKHDKLKKSAVEDSMNTIRTTLHLPEDVPVIPFSAVKGTGRDEVLQMIFDHVSGSQP